MDDIYPKIWTSVQLGCPKLQLWAVILNRPKVQLWNMILNCPNLLLCNYGCKPEFWTVPKKIFFFLFLFKETVGPSLMKLYTTPPYLLTLVTWVQQSKLKKNLKTLSKIMVNNRNFGQSNIRGQNFNFGRSKIMVQNRKFGRSKITFHNRAFGRFKITANNCYFEQANWTLVQIY